MKLTQHSYSKKLHAEQIIRTGLCSKEVLSPVNFVLFSTLLSPPAILVLPQSCVKQSPSLFSSSLSTLVTTELFFVLVSITLIPAALLFPVHRNFDVVEFSLPRDKQSFFRGPSTFRDIARKVPPCPLQKSSQTSLLSFQINYSPVSLLVL